MFQPDELKQDRGLFWSPGTGCDVWELFQACISGDLNTVRRRVLELFQVERQLTRDRPPHAERLTRVRRFLRQALAASPAVPVESETLDIEDSQLLVARAHGFEDWEALVKDTPGE